MVGKVLRRAFYFGTTVVAGTSLFQLSRNNWDIDSIGVIRFSRAACTAGMITLDYKYNVYGKTPSSPQEEQELWTNAHYRSAKRILDLCIANRGVFVKVGQHIGALDYLLPRPYIETLEVLHDRAPESSIEDVKRVIKEDLKNDADDIFEEFNTKALGAASLAQVYKARLKSGEYVAVKVQHANVKAHSFVDMKTMEILVKIAAYLFKDFKLLWLVEETKRNLPRELDFLHEAKNADMLRALMTHCEWLKIPKIYWDLSTDRVLVMEYCNGGKINDLSYMKWHNINPSEVSEKIGLLYSEMIFSHGFVHCDPHPGNLLVGKNPNTAQTEICLLDHGLYTTLSPEFRYNYSQLWLSIIHSNINGIKKYGSKLGVGEYYGLFASMVAARSWDSITSKEGIGKKYTAEEEKLIRKKIGEYLPQISEILDRVPRPMILIFKTNDLIRGIEHALKISRTMKSFTTMSKFCVKTVFNEDYKQCDSKFHCLKIKILENILLAKIQLYEIFLWIKYLVYPMFWVDIA